MVGPRVFNFHASGKGLPGTCIINVSSFPVLPGGEELLDARIRGTELGIWLYDHLTGSVSKAVMEAIKERRPWMKTS